MSRTIPTPAASGTRQSTTITGLPPNASYWFAIKAADEVPNWSLVSNGATAYTLMDYTPPAAVTLSERYFTYMTQSPLTPREQALYQPPGTA